MKKSDDYYYNVAVDVRTHPKFWAFLIVGGRNTGKTYSALKDCYENHRTFVFLKRTMDDVDILCSGSGRVGTKANQYRMDLSPFKAINRDIGSNVKAFSIQTGIGAFYNCNEEGEATGSPIGYLMALNAVSKYKGFDLSDCDWIIFDEFIPNLWDRTNRKEGEQLMDFYKTVSRDREHRGKDPLKLVCLANATSISNPTFNMLEVTDTVALMEATDTETQLLTERGIFIRILKSNPEFEEKEKSSQLYQAMGETSWGQMAFNNSFAYNDFSAIGKTSLKGYSPVCSISYKREIFYIYRRDGDYYMTRSRHNADETYNLNRENDQKLFYNERCIDLRLASIEGHMIFETYTMYDIIMNYKKFFRI